ncbi:MAG: response regulator [Lachnospiraceae bacterium]|nr:response regulator [Lachnospiraceae bacterium]
MKMIVVDDEPMSIEVLKYEVNKFAYVEVVGEFTCGVDALEYAKVQPVDIAVLDIQMCGMDGLQLGQQLKKMHPSILLVYLSAYENYASQVVKLQAEAYLTKPVSSGELEFVLEIAFQKIVSQNKRIFARTFGHFDLYVDGKPIMFRSAKAKELLALLIDREGGTVTTEQIICTLWEDRPNDEATQSLCSKVGKTLEKELQMHRAEELVVSARGVKRLNTDVLECDLYQLLKRDTTATDKFLGEYMLEYSWAENRMALLERYL